MGRWKNQGGQAVWDENDSGPDQIQPAPGQEKPGQGGAPPNPFGGPPQNQPPQGGGDFMPPGQGDWGKYMPKFPPGGFKLGQTPQTDWSQYRTTPEQQGETSQQTYDRFQNDYHSEDKDKVMRDLLMARNSDPANWQHLMGQAGSQGNINNGPGSQGDIYKPSTDATTPGTTPSTQTPPEGGWQSHLGWDTGKLNDPNKHDAKYDWLRAVQMAGGNKDLNKVVDIYNKIGGQYGESAKYSGTGDKVDFTGGNENGSVDVLFDQEGKREDLWAPQGGGGNESVPGASSGLGGVSPAMQALMSRMGGNTGVSGGAGFLGGGTTPGGLGGVSAGGGGLVPGLTDRNNTLWGILSGRQGQSLDVNPKDPIIAGQVNSFRAEQERGLRNQLSQQAESQGPSANLNSEKRMGAERVAQTTGNMQGQLMQSELGARRQEIQNALSQMGGMLSQDQQLALQRELGLIDANLRQQGVTNQNSQFMDQLGFNSADRAAYWDAVRRGIL